MTLYGLLIILALGYVGIQFFITDNTYKKIGNWALVVISVLWLFSQLKSCFTSTPEEKAQEEFLETLPKNVRVLQFGGSIQRTIYIPVGKRLRTIDMPETKFPYSLEDMHGNVHTHYSARKADKSQGFLRTDLLYLYSDSTNNKIAYWFE